MLTVWVLAVAVGCSSKSDEISVADFGEMMRDRGVPTTVVDCVVEDAPDPITREFTDDGGKLLELLFGCSGLPRAQAACNVAMIEEVVGVLDGDAIVDFDTRADPTELRAMSLGALECRGFTIDQAECAMRGLEDEHGDVFDAYPTPLSSDQQMDLEQHLVACSEDTDSAADSVADLDEPLSAQTPSSTAVDEIVAAPATSTPVSNTVPGQPTNDLCAQLEAAFDAYHVADHAGAQAGASAIAELLGTLRFVGDDMADRTMRFELTDGGALLGGFASALEVVAEGDFDADLADALSESTFEMIDSGFLLLATPTISIECPTLTVSELEFGFALEDFLDAATRLLDEADGNDERLGYLRAMVEQFEATQDRNSGEPSSEHEAAFDACSMAPNANGPGDDPGCDELYAACEGGDMLACNDLYWISPLGSTYEEFAASCGDRSRFGGLGYAGFCDEITGT